ncbi:MAG: hypothetical protein P1P87_16605 [Trueperaceae bacterium]|nr:hypothetical protein [Trueperaceae bacterium]
MTATLTTAALLLVPFLLVVGVGAVAVAIHDAIARAWALRRAAVVRPVAVRARRVVRAAPRSVRGRAGAPAYARSARAPIVVR